ncbi:MAG: ParB/RepB/Spo0J family partition protein [Isosphaeraceae bacterium]|nr:ParB/RepB/Spo0J family partition protein [Isosphaeraceae bacterium]
MALEQIQEVLIAMIVMIPLLRKHVDEEKLAGLMQSIQQVGLLYPPRLTRHGDKYLPADGYHRILAMMKLGHKSIPAIIEEKPLSEGEMLHKGLIANNQRVENTPVEKAEGIHRLMEVTGWNASTVAEKLGLSNATVSRLLALLQLPEEIRERVHRGEIPASTAYGLVRAKDGETQAALASQAASGQITRDAVAGTVRSQNGGDKNGSQGRTSRVCCKLGSGNSVTVCGASLDLEDFIAALEEVLAKARKARSQGIEVTTLAKMFRDQARA